MDINSLLAFLQETILAFSDRRFFVTVFTALLFLLLFFIRMCSTFLTSLLASILGVFFCISQKL